MSFDAAAVADLLDVITSGAQSLGLFEVTTSHEPKTAPGPGLSCAVWVDGIRPAGQSSGLAATSGVVSFFIRVYNPMITDDDDAIDPAILSAVTALMNLYTGEFDFGEVAQVRNIDLLGQHSADGMFAQAGYMQISGKMFRVMVLMLPVIVNDLWTQEGGE